MTNRDRRRAAFSLGTGAGLAVGAALGFAIDNYAIGAGVAIALGLTFGMLLRVMRVIGGGRED